MINIGPTLSWTAQFVTTAPVLGAALGKAETIPRRSFYHGTFPLRLPPAHPMVTRGDPRLRHTTTRPPPGPASATGFTLDD